MSLITRARAWQNLPSANQSGGSADETHVDALILAATKTINKYCARTFESTLFDEIYDGSGDRYLMLRNYPVISVQSVRSRQVAVLKVKNTSGSNQKARVSVTSTGILLSRTSSGTVTTNTLLFSDSATISAMATAIAGVANGWTAVAVSGYENYPSADLYPPIQGAQNAAGVYCDLRQHADELSGYGIDAARGMLSRAVVATDPDYRMAGGPVWPRGVANLRVQYTAGYSTVPEDVQEAAAMTVAALFRAGAREQTGPAAQLPNEAVALLNPYRQYPVSRLAVG